MNVPLDIAEKGGETLKNYIRTQEEIDNKMVEFIQGEAEIKKLSHRIYEIVGDFLPDADIYERHYKWGDIDFLTRNVIHNIDRKSNIVVSNFMVAEDLMKEIRRLIMDRKVLDHDINYLKRKQELRRQGEIE